MGISYAAFIETGEIHASHTAAAMQFSEHSPVFQREVKMAHPSSGTSCIENALPFDTKFSMGSMTLSALLSDLSKRYVDFSGAYGYN